MSQSNTRWSQVVKGSAKSDQEDHQAGHATLQSRDPPPNTSYADLSTPSAASPSISISTSARATAKGHRDNVSQVLGRVSASTVHAGAGQPVTSESESAFPSLQSANPHDPHDVDPVLAPLVDDSIAQAAIRDVPVEISKAAKSADIKQGATAANALAAAAESSASSSATHTTPNVKKSDLGRALEEIEPRNEEPSVTIETPEPVVPLTETTRGGTAVQLGVIEATQQNIPIRSSAGTAGAPHDKSVIDQATGGFVPGTQEHIEPESYATTTDQPEFTQDASETESAGETKQRAGPSVIEQATQGFVPGTQERILHAPGTSAPPPTPISQLGAPPASQGAEAQVPLLPETTAGKHADREAKWVPLDPESSTPHTRHAVAHVAHKAKQTVPTSAQEIKETAAQAVHKAKDVMPTRESVSAAISTGASAAKSAADQVSTTVSDTAAQAKATVDSAYDSATSTASSAIDTIKSTLLSSTSAESSRAEPLSHAERAEVLLDQIKDSAATGPDAVRATLAAGSSSSLPVESGSIGGLTGPTPPAKDHPALAATRHGHKMSPEEAAEARADSLFAKFGGGGAHKQASEPQPSATSVSVSGGGTTAAQLVESTPTSASRADQILANYESAAQIGPDAVRAALAAGTTHYPHPSQLQDKPKDVPPAVAQRILEQARASIDQLTASGHSEVDLVASESSPSATSSAIDTTIGEGLDYAASFARGVRAGITQATRDIERDVYETIRKSEGELAIPTTRTAEQVEHVRVEASEAAQHRAEDALAPILAEGPVETIKHVADDVITKVESGLLSIAESVGLVRHETEE